MMEYWEQKCLDLDRTVQELKSWIALDCGDHSCRFALDHTGQRTNGGCSCPQTRHPQPEDARRWDALKLLNDAMNWRVQRFVFDANGQNGNWALIDRYSMDEAVDKETV